MGLSSYQERYRNHEGHYHLKCFVHGHRLFHLTLLGLNFHFKKRRSKVESAGSETSVSLHVEIFPSMYFH